MDNNVEDEIAKSYEGDDHVFGTETEPDKCVTLSTGYWRNANSLEESYVNKFQLIAEKLQLKKGMRILDVGCGEGTLCKFLAENYDVNVVGNNISKQQIIKARKLCDGYNVQIEEVSGLKVNGRYDRITCIQVIEHFGLPNLRPFFERLYRCLINNGLLLLEVNLISDSIVPTTDAYLNSMYKISIPLTSGFFAVIDGLFVIEELINVSNDMYLTSKADLINRMKNRDKYESIGGQGLLRSIEALYATYASLQRNRCYNLFFVILSKNGANY